MNTKLIAAGFFLLLASVTAHATSIELGPSRVFTYADQLNGDYGIFRTVPSFGVDGRAFDGQTVSYNVTFGGNFIRVFHDTQSLFVRTDIIVNGGVPFPTNSSGFSVGSAYFLNRNGGKESNRFPLIGAFESIAFPFDITDIAIFGSKSLDHPPRDVYGFHVDLNFNYPGLVIDEDRFGDRPGSGFRGSVDILAGGKYKKNAIFGVGPNLPADIVADGENTADLLPMALVGIAWFNWKRKLKPQQRA